MFLTLLPLLFTVISPILTEMVKGLADKINATVPPNVNPIIGGAIGTVAGIIAQTFDPSLNVGPVIGGTAGLAGTGIHQALFAHKFHKVKKGA